MKRTIELTEKELADLEKRASLNRQEIANRSFEMYKQKGVYEIVLSINTRNGSDYDDVKIEPSCYITSQDSYKLDIDTKRNLIEFVKRKCSEFFIESYGEHLKELGNIKKIRRKEQSTYFTFKLITILGWAMALGMFLILYLNK